MLNSVKINGKVGKFQTSGKSKSGRAYWYGKIISVDLSGHPCIIDLKAFGKLAERIKDEIHSDDEISVSGFISNQLDGQLSNLLKAKYYKPFIQIKTITKLTKVE